MIPNLGIITLNNQVVLNKNINVKYNRYNTLSKHMQKFVNKHSTL